MVGSISTLGIGSGIDLQGMLDQLRAVDQQAIDLKKTEVTNVTKQLDEFTVVKNKLLTIKSKALDLSLASTFIKRSVSSSSESFLTATVVDGATVTTNNIKITSLATKSSWESSVGFQTNSKSIYVPVSQESTTGVTDPDIDTFAASGETLTITYGGTKTFTVTAASDLTLNQVVDEINNHADNQGGPGTNSRYVTAETYVSGGKSYLRIKSDRDGTGEANRVAVSETMASISFAPPNATLSYRVGATGDVITVSVAADTTLDELASQINTDSDNSGITASVINKGDGSTPYRLLLTADDTGEDNRITILSAPGDIPLAEQQGAVVSLNANIELDGITYERQSNTVTDFMNGVTLNLLGIGSSTVTVSEDNESVVDLIKGLVEAYNDAINEVNSNSAYDNNTKQYGILFSTTLRDMPYSLESLMTTVVKTAYNSTVTTLFDLGLEFARDGSITIDEEMLTDAVNNNPDDVQAFFNGNDEEDITGFASLVNDRMRVLTSSSGQIAAEKTASENRVDTLQQEIDVDIERLDKKYEIMAKQFSELDRYMQQMTSISNYLAGQLASLSSTGSDSKSGK